MSGISAAGADSRNRIFLRLGRTAPWGLTRYSGCLTVSSTPISHSLGPHGRVSNGRRSPTSARPSRSWPGASEKRGETCLRRVMRPWMPRRTISTPWKAALGREGLPVAPGALRPSKLHQWGYEAPSQGERVPALFGLVERLGPDCAIGPMAAERIVLKANGRLTPRYPSDGWSCVGFIHSDKRASGLMHQGQGPEALGCWAGVRHSIGRMRKSTAGGWLDWTGRPQLARPDRPSRERHQI